MHITPKPGTAVREGARPIKGIDQHWVSCSHSVGLAESLVKVRLRPVSIKRGGKQDWLSRNRISPLWKDFSQFAGSRDLNARSRGPYDKHFSWGPLLWILKELNHKQLGFTSDLKCDWHTRHSYHCEHFMIPLPDEMGSWSCYSTVLQWIFVYIYAFTVAFLVDIFI